MSTFPSEKGDGVDIMDNHPTAPPPYPSAPAGVSYNAYPNLPTAPSTYGIAYYPNPGPTMHQPLPQPVMYNVQHPQQPVLQHALVVNSMANNPPGPRTTVVTTTKKTGVNHCLHAIITIFFFPWIVVWVVLCCLDSKEKRQTTVIKM